MAALFIIAVVLVVLCVLGLIHILTRLLNICGNEETERRQTVVKKGEFFASRHLSQAELSAPGAKKESIRETQLSHQSFELERESKWKGWSETIRDEDTRQSYSSTHQRSVLGCMNISAVDPNGKFIVVSNVSGTKPKDQDVSGWEIIRRIDGKRERVFIFPAGSIIKANMTCKIYARGKGMAIPPKSFVFDGDTTWGTGDVAETFLMNKGEVQTSLYWNTSSLDIQGY